MPNLIWSRLNHLQLGKYAEYYAKMEFTSYGFEVYTSEVDDHGVDFVCRAPGTAQYYEIQVKSIRNTGYVFESKDKMPLTENRIMCLLCFKDGALPDMYLIPSLAWEQPNSVFVDRRYDKPGQKSKPEWGINISAKNMDVLEKYKEENFLENIIINVKKE